MSEIKPEDIISNYPPKIRLDTFAYAEMSKSCTGEFCLMITVPPRPSSIDVGGKRIEYLHLGPKAYRKLIEFLNKYGDKSND